MAFIRNKNIVLRNIHDTYFLIDITDNYQDDKCVIYEINEIGKFIWENINEKTVEDVAKELHSIIIEEIEYQVVYNDVLEYVNILLEKNFIRS